MEVSHERGAKERIMESDALRAAVAEEERVLAGEGRVLVRASGTEPLIRVMVEAKTTQRAKEVAEKLASFVKTLKI